MKSKYKIYWLISALFLALAALWGAFAKLSEIVSVDNVCAIALIVFGVISVIAAFNSGIKSSGSGWILSEGVISFCIGISYVFQNADYSVFTLDLGSVTGLWLMFMGISQINGNSKKSRGFAEALVIILSAIAVLAGLAVLVRPVADLTEFAKVHTVTFRFTLAALLVLCRLMLKGSRK